MTGGYSITEDIKVLKRLIAKYFDYDIVGEYLAPLGNGKYQKKYKKRYYLKCFAKRKRIVKL